MSGRDGIVISSFVPEDRLAALAAGATLPVRARGAVLFADVVGFTALSGTLVEALGEQRGAEELTRILNGAFGLLVEAVESHSGSVVAFAGDAMICWFDADDGTRAIAAGVAMREAMAGSPAVEAPGVSAPRLAIRVAVSAGDATRLLLGDPAVQVVEALAGEPLERLSVLHRAARPGEVLLDRAASEALAGRVDLGPWREAGPGVHGAPMTGSPVVPASTSAHAPRVRPEVSIDELRPWVPPVVFQRLTGDQASLVPGIRPAVAMFVGVDGLEPGRSAASAAQLSAYVAHVQTVLTRNGGVLVDVTTGDKGTYLFGAFGVPVAHGDDLLRAAWTAQELRTAPASSGIAGIRIGLASGAVYAGILGAPRRSCYGIRGTTVNVAARLMEHAAPGEVLLSGGFGAATARRFEIRPLPPQFLKGFTAPVPASDLIGLRAPRSVRLPEPQYTVPIVGRRGELRRAVATIRLAGAGQGQVLGLAGEPGMGKSRLLAEVIQLATAAGFDAFVGAVESFGTAVPYIAWRPLWRQFFGLADDASPEDELVGLEAYLGGVDHALPAQLPLLGPLLGLQIPDNEITGPIPVPARKRLVADILLRCLADRAAAQPVLLALEDCHGFDSVSLELLADVRARLADLPVLLVATYRPPANDQPHPLGPEIAGSPSEIDLGAFDEDDAAELIQLKLGELFGLAGDAPEPLVRRITDQAHGNPFYLEELLNHLSDTAIDPSDPSALDVELPTSLQSLILDRLDRLPAEQQLALKGASIIGRRFRTDWLRGAYPELGSAEAVRAALDALARVDLIAQDGTGADAAYLFKHVATRDVAYQSLAFETRETWHETLAAYLERELADAPPVELLAQHYGQSRNRSKELSYVIPAGEQAVAQGAYREARQYLQRGIEIVRGQDASPARSEAELALQLGMGGVMLTTHGQGSPEAKACFDRAFELTGEVPPGPDLVRALFGLWTFYLFRGDMRPTSELAHEILGAAERFANPEALLQAHFAMSATVYWLGDFEGTATHADEVNRLYEPAKAALYVARYAQNPRITAAADAAWAEWILGRPDAARRRCADTVAHARELGHDFVTTIALQVPAFTAVHMGDVPAAASATLEWLGVAGRVGNPIYLGLASACLGWAKAAGGEPEEGLRMLGGVRQGFLDQGVEVVDPLLATMLADAFLRSGRGAAGFELLATTMERAEAKGQLAYLAEQHRLRGELRLVAGSGVGSGESADNPAREETATGAPIGTDGTPVRVEAEADFRRAIEIARGQGARSYELRAAMSLARLLAGGDRAAEAYDELRAVRAMITEGPDTPDLQAADALLAGGPPARLEATIP